MQNMTTLCENWGCTFHDAGGGSQNHIMLGGFDAWLQSSLGGLDSAVNGRSGGWRHMIVRVSPEAAAALKQARVSRQTRFGEASLSWTAADGKLSSKLVVPIGVEAEVHSPAAMGGRRLSTVTRNGRVVWSHETGAVDREMRAAVAWVGSGTHEFKATYE